MGAPSQSFMPVVTSSGTLEEAFPDVDPNFEPFGVLVLLQVRVAKRKVGGSSYSAAEAPEIEASKPKATSRRRMTAPWNRLRAS